MGEHIFIYVDDIIVSSCTLKDRLIIWKKIEHPCEVGQTISFEKCYFCKSSLLIKCVDKDGIHTDPTNIAATSDFPYPKTAADIRRFPGISKVFRNYCFYF